MVDLGGSEHEADPYESEVHRWWHLSDPSPELREAVDDGYLAGAGRFVDLGCFHYLGAAARPAYAGEVARVLRPAGRLLLRACLRSAGRRNDVDATLIRSTFSGLQILSLEEAELASDTRSMPALVLRARRP